MSESRDKKSLDEIFVMIGREHCRHAEQASGSELRRLSRGKYRFMFVKKAIHRTAEEERHIDDVLKGNQHFS